MMPNLFSLTNLSSNRHRPPSLEPRRKVGFTESWAPPVEHDQPSSGSDGGSTPEARAFELPYLPARYITVLSQDCDCFDSKSTSSAHKAKRVERASGPSPTLRLTQYRPCWAEQLVLRICNIPHTVENTSYAASESTGGMPSLLDVPSNDSSVDEPFDSRPILVGRNHPGGLGSGFADAASTPAQFFSSGSHIVDYLRVRYPQQIKDNVHFPEHHYSADALAYDTLIQEKLAYILQALRYGHGPAWNGIYRQQCVRASIDPNAKPHGDGKVKSLFFPIWAWYQAYSERALALKNILPSSYTVPPASHGGLSLELFRYNDYRRRTEDKANADDVEDEGSKSAGVHQQHPYSSLLPSFSGSGGGSTGMVNVFRAMEYADLYYTALEGKIESNRGSRYFLGTSKPTYIDIALFAHLSEALCDIHLILVLAKHSTLVKYFQFMHDQYFGEEYTKRVEKSGEGSFAWVQQNNVTNSLNAFNQLPNIEKMKLGARRVLDADGQDMAHVIELMQRFSVHCHELDEALRNAAAIRLSEGDEKNVLISYHRPFGSTLYRWLMGADVTLWGSKMKTATADDSDDDDDSRSDAGDEGGQKAEDPIQKRAREKMKQERRTNDELWLSAVVVSIITIVLVSSRK